MVWRQLRIPTIKEKKSSERSSPHSAEVRRVSYARIYLQLAMLRALLFATCIEMLVNTVVKNNWPLRFFWQCSDRGVFGLCRACS